MYEEFADREQASQAAADLIEHNLKRRLAQHPEATLIVSGGGTPGRCLEMLASRDLPWERLHVTLSDERWVPADSPDSNEYMLRQTLLQGAAIRARFFPLYREKETIEASCELVDERLRQLPLPFACTLLGMGEDGHFASLFPDADNLSEGLEVDNQHLCLPVRTAAGKQPRLSLTLTALSRSDDVVLLIYGDAKRKVFNEASEFPDKYPVSRLLRQKRAPVHVFWAP